MIIFPPNDGYREIKLEDYTVFLAGPIQGAEDWQREAQGILWDNFHDEYRDDNRFGDTRLWIANPRSENWHRDYEAQVKWETCHLETACWGGVIMVWCAKEQTHYCDRPHGQTTRFELGEWIGKKQVLWSSWRRRVNPSTTCFMTASLMMGTAFAACAGENCTIPWHKELREAARKK